MMPINDAARFSANPPSTSRELLRSLIGSRLSNMVRYSWWPADVVSKECSISNEQAFPLTAGPLLMIMDCGVELGVASSPELNSITVWDEKYLSAIDPHSAMRSADDLFPILATDFVYAGSYWNDLVGSTLRDICFLKRRDMSLGEKARVSEVGLVFYFDGDRCVIASHGMRDGSDVFSVLSGKEFTNFSEFIKFPI